MQTTKDHINTLNLFDKSDKILVAVSGGKDSIALAHFLSENGFDIGIAHVNFHLRGDESDADEAFVHLFAQSLGVPFHLHHCEFDGKGNLQDWARNERYQFFNSVKENEGYNKVATGHHKDDQVETVLHNLLRGTGIRGVRGMMANRDGLIRPFLKTSRSEIEAYLQQHHLSFREDSSNASTKYVRNQIRHQLVPLINEIGENSLEKLHSSITHLQADSLALSALIEKTISPNSTGFTIDLDGHNGNISATILYHAIHSLGFNRQQCQDLCHSNAGAIIETETYIATKSESGVVVRNQTLTIPDVPIPSTGTYKQMDQCLTISSRTYSESEMPKSAFQVWMDKETVEYPLVWRAYYNQEKFTPLGADYDVEINKYLKDGGLDRLTRSDTPVLADAVGKVIWIPGIQLSDSVKCTSSTKSVITFELS